MPGLNYFSGGNWRAVVAKPVVVVEKRKRKRKKTAMNFFIFCSVTNGSIVIAYLDQNEIFIADIKR